MNLIHCGPGHTRPLSARLLVELGLPPEEAILPLHLR